MAYGSLPALAILLVFAAPGDAQTTQGLITGYVRDSITGVPVPNAEVFCQNDATNTRARVSTSETGAFAIPLLPPGRYRISVSAPPNYQTREVDEMELLVAAVLDLDVRLRPISDIWERGQLRSVFVDGRHSVLNFYGPDLDTSYSGTFEPPDSSQGKLDTSVSNVVDTNAISTLPLAGRDVFTALVLQPAVAADTATTRGIGISVNGQRPSSTNYLLDGAENNNSLLSGPLLAIAPEAVQEYRISTSNYSAEYGRTSGSVTNAITHSGGDHWNGVAAVYVGNGGLNANEFQRNRSSLPRLPLRSGEYGVRAGGPLVRNRLFESVAVDFLRSRGQLDTEQVLLPSIDFMAQLRTEPNLGRGAKTLVDNPPPKVTATAGQQYGSSSIEPTVTYNRLIGLNRIDLLTHSGTQRWMFRLLGAVLDRPDFYWSPYNGFSTGFSAINISPQVGLITTMRGIGTNEVRLTYALDRSGFDRPHPEVPDQISRDGVQLPGAGILYSFKYRVPSIELTDNFAVTAGKHIFKAGVDVFRRSISQYLTMGRDGRFYYPTLSDFVTDAADEASAGADRLAKVLVAPDYDRRYRNGQYAGFIQDSWRVTQRLTLNGGIRYDYFGAPTNIGNAKDAILVSSGGPDMIDWLTQATIVLPATGDQLLYDPDHSGWAFRAGASFALERSGRTVLRAAHGIFYDRPFDNLWMNVASNAVVLVNRIEDQPVIDASGSALAAVAAGAYSTTNLDRLTYYERGMRIPRVHSSFVGIQHQLARNLLIEVNGLASSGDRLITTDRINRQNSVDFDLTNMSGRYNPALPDIRYRANQGFSEYRALTASALYRATYLHFQAAYTWSHSIDNQSEPLNGEFDDLSIANAGSGSPNLAIAAFATQFNAAADKGNSDFDQRHTFALSTIYIVPPIRRRHVWNVWLSDWQIAGLAAVRSGLPFTAFASLGPPALNPRADVLDPGHAYLGTPVDGGVQLLNPAAFAVPEGGLSGSTGRNAFAGPGMYNIDLSLSRTFRPRKLSETFRFILRVDAFNVLNHANLTVVPAALTRLGSNGAFGTARYGVPEHASGFPTLTPVQVTARQIQLVLRAQF